MTTVSDMSVNITNRPTGEQLERIYDMLDECFTVGRAFFQARLDRDSAYDPDTTWFATVDGELAANVQIFPLSIRVGQSVLKTGAIGSVGTAPQYRGMGLAHKILDAQTKYMQETDYDISVLLASKHGFYEKAGWRLIPETAYSIEKPASSEQQSVYAIIPFEARYLDEIRSIYEQFNRNRTYTVVRNEAYWNDLMNWPEWNKSDCLLLLKNDKVVAYGMIEKKDSEQVFIHEVLYLNEAEDGVEHLFHALCRLRPNAKHIAAMLPEDHILYSYYQRHQAQAFQIHMAMWKMINLKSTFHKLQPELEQRLIGHDSIADQSLHIALRCGEDRIYLDYKDKRLSISDVSRPHAYIPLEIDERNLMTAIMFGYQAEDATTEHAAALQALFPKQQAVFYFSDKF
jgi:predicted acetyltransferase